MKKLLTVGIFLTTFVLTFSCHATPYSEFYFFGDSLSDVGNNGCETNKDANTGECMTWATDLHFYAFNAYAKPSSAGGTDYAVGGATTIDTLNQVNQYLNTHHQADPNAYYFILAGGNDVMNLATDTTSQVKTKIDALQPLQAVGVVASAIGNFNNNLEGTDGSAAIITHETDAIKALYNAGAKHIMVINLPDISITPTIQNAGNDVREACQKSVFVPKSDQSICLEIGQGLEQMAGIFIRDYNDALNRKIQANFDLSMVKTFSMFDMAEQVVKDDVLNPNGSCSGTVQECEHYLFYNGVHPGAAAHKIMANKIFNLI